jgi:TIR domain-containing protein/tetratricopeptide repeat protein/NB-ARC domain-containing protein
MSIFINYRGTDSRSYAALLHAEFSRQFGAEMVFLDSASIPAGADYVDELLTRVRSAAVVLAIIGPSWLTAELHDPNDWIRRELTEAFLGGVRVIPVLVDDATMPVEVELPDCLTALSRCQFRRLRHRDAAQDLDRLAGDLVAIVDNRKAAHPPVAWNVPPRNPNFTGRRTELDLLADSLVAASAVTVQGLVGMGGVGKTQLAIEYAHQHAHDYEVVWWLNAEDHALLPGQLSELGREMGLPAAPDANATVRAVQRELRHRERWLLIFDNADDAETVRSLLPAGAGHVLVTTRRAGFRALGPVLPLGVLPRAESVALLRKRAPDLDNAEGDALAGLLGDLPLALDQASAFMEHTGIPAADYRQLVTTRTAQMYDRGEPSYHKHTISRLWQTSLDRLGRDHPAAVQLLNLCAWLAPEPIPLTLIADHPHLLPHPLDGIASDPVELTETVGALLDLSLARRTANGLIIHRLVQSVIRESSTDPHGTICALLRANLAEEIWNDPSGWPRWHQLIPHVLVAVAKDATSEDAAWLLERAGAYHYMFGSPELARTVLERALLMTEALYGPAHLAMASVLNKLAQSLSDSSLALHREAAPFAERALAIFRAHDHRAGVVETSTTLASILDCLGRPAAARELLEPVLGLAEDLGGPSHPSVASVLTVLAAVMLDLDRPTAAVPDGRALSAYPGDKLRSRTSVDGGTDDGTRILPGRSW